MKQVFMARTDKIILRRDLEHENFIIEDVKTTRISDMWGDRLLQEDRSKGTGLYYCEWIVETEDKIIAKPISEEMLSVDKKGWTIHV